jgi:hypothetical protein
MSEVGDEDFHKLATHALNKEALYYTPEVDEMKESFVRALKMHGYNVKEIETGEGLDAIFGYHLVLSAIYYLILLFRSLA